MRSTAAARMRGGGFVLFYADGWVPEVARFPCRGGSRTARSDISDGNNSDAKHVAAESKTRSRGHWQIRHRCGSFTNDPYGGKREKGCFKRNSGQTGCPIWPPIIAM